MEHSIRTSFYNKSLHLTPSRTVVFDPFEPEPFDLVDVTLDITNSTRIYHLRTECIREALAGASHILTDSPALASTIQLVLPRVQVSALPYGSVGIAPVVHEQTTVGLLNHSGDVQMNNAYALTLLKSLNQPLLIYGEKLEGFDEGEVEEDFRAFCDQADIVLLPSLPGAINSMTLPLALMEAGVALLCHNAPGYYNLDAATGVRMLPDDQESWQDYLKAIIKQPSKLLAMQQRNQVFALRQNLESTFRLHAALAQPPTPAKALSEGCGCKKSSKTAPAKPAQDQSTSELQEE